MEISKGLLQILGSGGWVSYPMLAMLLVLWYSLGQRWQLLQTKWSLASFKQNLSMDENLNAHETEVSRDIVGHLVNEIVQNVVLAKNQAMAVKSYVQATNMKLKYGKKIITSIVAAAPLLGLLGTVVGMIETFDSMTDMTLISKTGGIAGGISQALVTTQMGLVVAIPGVLFDRYLDQKEKDIKDLLQVVEDKSISEVCDEAV